MPRVRSPKIMNATRLNLIASFVGHGGVAVLGLALTPAYVALMGIESFGLVGFYLTLFAALTPLGLGLGTAVNRKLAATSSPEQGTREVWEFVRTLEIVYWAMGGALAGLLLALAPIVARHWLTADALSSEDISQTVMLMAAALLVQWPIGYYANGLAGLQRQVLLNATNLGMTALRVVGVLLPLWLLAPTVQVFFAWQAAVYALHAGLLALVLRWCLPPAKPPAPIRLELLRGVWRFSAGITGISAAVLLLTQVDKLLLSRLLPLEELGYFMVANLIATGLTLFSGPVAAVLLPRFAHLVARGDHLELKKLYHDGCRLISVLMLPAGIVLIVFAEEVLFVWTGSANLVANTHTVARLLAVGTLLNGLNTLPFALQVAHGWTRLTLFICIVLLIVLLPLIVVLCTIYGGVGAAVCWVLLNGTVFVAYSLLMFRRILGGERRRWLLADIGVPLLASLVPLGLFRLALPGGMGRLPLGMVLLGITLLATLGCFLATRRHVSWYDERREAAGAERKSDTGQSHAAGALAERAPG